MCKGIGMNMVSNMVDFDTQRETQFVLYIENQK